MTEENFFYWLQGYFELSESDTISKEQLDIIIEHIKIVKTCGNNLSKIELLLDLYKEETKQEYIDKIKKLVSDFFLKVTKDKKPTVVTSSHPHYCSGNTRAAC